ncbi:MAG: helix-turn-helix transcriptional regulator [Acidobacteriota bacterium]
MLEVLAWNRAIKLLRKRSGMTQAEAVDAARGVGVKVSVSAWSGWEQDEPKATTPKLDLFWPALRALGFTSDEIYNTWRACHDDLVDEAAAHADSVDVLELMRRKVAADPNLGVEVITELIGQIGNDDVRAELEQKFAYELTKSAETKGGKV